MKLKSRNWLLMAVVILFIIGIKSISTYKLKPVEYFSGSLPYVVAYQGGEGLRPGNSMLAFQNARALGVDVLEMDLHGSRDGELVLIHDDSVDRTTNGSGKIKNMSLVELKALDAGYHWPFARSEDRPYRDAGVKIPRLSEVFEAFPDSRYLIEIKQQEPSIVTQLCAMLTRYDVLGSTMIASADEQTLSDFRTTCPTGITSSYSSELYWFLAYHYLGLVRLYQPASYVLQVPTHIAGYSVMNEKLVSSAARRGMHIDVFLAGNEMPGDGSAMQVLLDQGVSGIVSAYPDRLLKLMGRL